MTSTRFLPASRSVRACVHMCMALMLMCVFVLTQSTVSRAWTPSYPLVSATLFGGPSTDHGTTVVVDAVGNFYSTGWFMGAVDFDPGAGTTTLTAHTGFDAYVTKFSASGALIWAKSFGNSGSDLGYGIGVDSAGNVYVSGSYEGTVDFDPGAGTVNLTSAGAADAFVSKFDANGNLLWARSFAGSTAGDAALSAAVDANGNVYLNGIYRGVADFDPGAGTVNLTNAGMRDVFVAKFDASGNYVWAKGFGNSGDDQVYGIKVDSLGNVFSAGAFTGTVDFDPGAGTTNSTSAGASDAFISKLDTSGNFVWAKTFGGTGSDLASSGDLDSSGNVYVTGYFSNTADFDPGAGTANSTVLGSTDVYVLKLDALGSYQWVRAFGGSSTDSGQDVAIDPSGSVLVTGYYTGTVDFDPGAGTANSTAVGSNDAFVSKLDSSGSYVWVKTFGGSASDSGYSIASDSSGNVISTGDVTGTADLDPGAGTANFTATGGTDVYLMKMNSLGDVVVTTTTTSTTTTVTPSSTVSTTTTTVGGGVSNASVTTTTSPKSTAGTTAELPSTGSSSLPYVLWSFVVVAFGFALRRRAHHAK